MSTSPTDTVRGAIAQRVCGDPATHLDTMANQWFGVPMRQTYYQEGVQGGVSKTVNSKIQALKTVNSKKFCLKTINSKNYDFSPFSHFCVICVISTAHDQSVLWSY